MDLSEISGPRPSVYRPPDVFGLVAAGAGPDRQAGRFRLTFRSPPLLYDTHAVIEVDANILTADDTDELYYFYHVGLERGGRYPYGVYFHHRSNHELTEPNETVTDLNVLEGGVQTRHWDRLPDPPGSGEHGRLDWRVRAGYLVNARIPGDNEGCCSRFYGRAGIRYMPPISLGRFHTYLQAEIEGGETLRQAYAAGFLHETGAGGRLEYRDDDQYFGRDETALLLLATYYF